VRVLAACVAATTAVTVSAASTATAASPAPTATVTVAAGSTLATIRPNALGTNSPTWNPIVLDPEVPGLLHKAGLQTMTYDGGGVSDLYHWADNSISPDPDPAGHADYASIPLRLTFDQFAGVASRAGQQMFIHVNYGTGTPQEAAGWVNYANHVKHLNIKQWAIGQEVWGNGGALASVNFEPDGHADKSGTAYGQNALAYIAAMKAVDPTIRVGVELSGFPGGPFQDWDRAVLQVAGPAIDFVDFHFYQFSPQSDADVLQVPRSIPGQVAALRALVDQYQGVGHHVDLVTGETNSNVIATPQSVSQTEALYAADDVLSLLENGVASVDWWALHNGNYGVTGGDFGLLSSGPQDCSPDGTLCPPPRTRLSRHTTRSGSSGRCRTRAAGW